jgi:transposase InsO family protein
MPLHYNLQIEIFDVWNIDFMGPFQKSQDHFGMPRMVISDGGSHFIDKTFRAFLRELGAKHNIATPYHP